jgi:hypothetical protein
MIKQPSLTPIPHENKYELARDYEIQAEGVEIVVPRHFRYDGASIPGPAWQLTYTPFHPDVMVPALIHDWMYYNHQEDREVADDVFYRLLKDNGVSNLMANVMWGAVRTGGGLFWDNDEEDEEFLLKLCKKVRERPNFDRYKFPPEITHSCNG